MYSGIFGFFDRGCSKSVNFGLRILFILMYEKLSEHRGEVISLSMFSFIWDFKSLFKFGPCLLISSPILWILAMRVIEILSVVSDILGAELGDLGDLLCKWFSIYDECRLTWVTSGVLFLHSISWYEVNYLLFLWLSPYALVFPLFEPWSPKMILSSYHEQLLAEHKTVS